MKCSFKNRSHWKKCFERKKSQTPFCCLCVNLPTVKIWGNQTNSLRVLAFYSVRFKWKNWFEKTTLNTCMSIRRVIFTFGQNLKPPFLCQYLFFFNDFFWVLICGYWYFLPMQNFLVTESPGDRDSERGHFKYKILLQSSEAKGHFHKLGWKDFN